ncbi:ABC transporter ATP-binding protein [Pseudomonas sp. dw_358]|uniref:ABC transporter ATP-binding protein n=1 Tax=Pseudomonas sp. dw_358 TaxID=2720083 RepID=UPI001BD50EB8|nr:ABC transporter ATP-binding protein [Pseudomonas sp. dw_358]
MAIVPIQPDVLAAKAHAVTPAAATRVAVQLDRVSKRLGGATALHGVSLHIFEGEFVTLLGPSGCGKSTLLNLLAGLAEADAGELFIDGVRVTDTPPAQRDIGLVSQNYALLAHLTVAKNVANGLQLRGVSKAEIAQRVEQTLALVKLDGYGDCKPRALSRGQQQRVALARVLVTRPKVLLLDEPFAALDKPLRLALQIELKDLQRKLGMTTLLVTHDQSEALGLSDRVVVMRAGRVRQVGTPDALYRHPQDAFVAGFVGDVNILPGRYLRRDSRATLDVGASALRVPSERVHAQVGERLDIFVRPEHIRLGPLGPNALLSATVVAHVFQGDHMDIHLDVSALGNTRIFTRQPGLDALLRWPVGTAAGLSFATDGVCAFAAVTPPSS